MERKNGRTNQTNSRYKKRHYDRNETIRKGRIERKRKDKRFCEKEMRKNKHESMKEYCKK